MSLLRTWGGPGPNIAPSSNASLDAQGKSLVHSLKDLILSAGHTMYGSSDGTTAAFDGVDRCTLDANYTWAAAGVNHSWFVTKSPTNNPSTGKSIYIGVSCSTGATNQNKVNVWFSSAAPTVAATNADPTWTANKTRTIANFQLARSPVANVHSHQLKNTAGDFVFFVSTDGVGYAASFFGYFTTVNPETGLLYPCWVACNYTDSGVGGFFSAASWTTANCACWGNDDLVATTGCGILDFYQNGGSWLLQFDGIKGTVVDPNAWPRMPVPIGMVHTVSGGTTGGFVGVLVDIGLAPTGSNTPQARGEPGTGSTELAKVGVGWFPTLGTAYVF